MPPSQVLKLNTDAWFNNEGKVGLGLAIHDSASRVVGFKIVKGLVCLDVNITEAMAIREGILFAQSLHCSSIIVKSDSVVLWFFLNIIWFPQKINHMAHSLARWVLFSSQEFFLANDVPATSKLLVLEDSPLSHWKNEAIQLFNHFFNFFLLFNHNVYYTLLKMGENGLKWDIKCKFQAKLTKKIILGQIELSWKVWGSNRTLFLKIIYKHTFQIHGEGIRDYKFAQLI